MTNMSYCRFQNTSNDLRDCVETLQDTMYLEDLDLSKMESYHLKQMEKLCRDYLDECERLLPFEGENDDEG